MRYKPSCRTSPQPPPPPCVIRKPFLFYLVWSDQDKLRFLLGKLNLITFFSSNFPTGCPQWLHLHLHPLIIFLKWEINDFASLLSQNQHCLIKFYHFTWMKAMCSTILILSWILIIRYNLQLLRRTRLAGTSTFWYEKSKTTFYEVISRAISGGLIKLKFFLENNIRHVSCWYKGSFDNHCVVVYSSLYNIHKYIE